MTTRLEKPAGLSSASFQGLLFTQLLTATNDNIFRWLAIGIGKQHSPDNVSQILMAGTACFVLPYLLLASPAGYLADRFSKTHVIVACKVSELVIMAIGMAAILLGNIWLLFTAVAMMGAQSALFGPSKLGSIPEMLPASKISVANGLFGLTTVAATVIGMAIGCWLSDATKSLDAATPPGAENWWLSALVLFGVALVGLLLSLLIKRLPAARPTRHFPWDAPVQTWRDIRLLASNRALLRVALGLVFFWSVGALAQLNIDQFAAQAGGVNESDKTPLLVCLVFGVGLGSVLAGIWSGGRVELGILPLGAAGIAVSAMLLLGVTGVMFDTQPAVSAVESDAESAIAINSGAGVEGSASMVRSYTPAFFWACVLLFFLGTSAGLFSVPLEAYLQHESPTETRGSILAAANFLTFAGVLVSAILFDALNYKPKDPVTGALGEPYFSARQIFFLFGFATIPVFFYIVCVIPQASIRFVVWLLSRTVYRLRVDGDDNLPSQGGVLLVPNHISWLDGILMLLACPRPLRMVVYAGNYFNNRPLQWMARLWGVIFITPNPKAIVRALKTANEALRNGEMVCMFAEGGISRSGQLQSFKPGIMKVLKGSGAKVVPVYLDGLWGSIFSYERGRFFWKWPRQVPYPISIYFGDAMDIPQDVNVIRRAVQDLGATAVQQRAERSLSPIRSFLRMAKKRKFKSKVADSMGTDVTGGALLTRALVLRRLLRRLVLADDEHYVGVLLPPSAGGVVVNTTLALDRRVSVNLNYTVASDVLNACIQHAGIKHVLTSRKFMEKMNFDLNAEMVYLDDFKEQVTKADKVCAALAAFCTPAAILERALGLLHAQPDDVLTVIFTSGSTGTPKGVMLTNANIASNVAAVEQAVSLTPQDVIIGILPFFHSFGYTITLWAVMSLDIKGAYHFSPLDAKQIGKLCQQHKGTILLTTPTFLRSYTRRCSEEEFATLDVVVAGAEKLPVDLCDAFEAKFHVRPVEGYGATELSPLVSVNIPPSRSTADSQVDAKEGTVGRPVDGVSAKITDLDSGATLGIGEAGMLWITGPNVMKGYLGRDDLTAEVVVDGWYKTGDVAFLDEDGFITITGRQSRFSKIGGEMVPHIRIEEELNRALGADEELKAAVTSVRDDKKGERLIVLHTKIDKTPAELRAALTEAGMPNIFLPSVDGFLEVEQLPVLGSGKLDLKGLQKIAEEHFAG